MYFQERKIRLQKLKDARVQQKIKIKKACSTNRGQEENTEEEMPNKRCRFCERGMHTATKKTKQKEQNKNPSHGEKRENC